VNESRTTTYNESAIFESSMQNRPINIIQGSAFTYLERKARSIILFLLATIAQKLILRILFVIVNN